MEIKSLTMIALFVVAVLIRAVRTQDHFDPFQFPMDLALIVDDSGSILDSQFDRIMSVVRKVPDIFNISEQETRVAVVQFSDESSVVLNLTGDPDELRNLKVDRKKGGTSTHRALQDVKDGVFVGARPDVMKIVILITDGESNNRTLAEEAAKELLDEGSYNFVAFIRDAYKKPGVKEHAEKLAGDKSRVLPIDNFADFSPKIFGIVMEQIEEEKRCESKEACHFNDQSQQSCVPFFWRNLTESDRPCNKTPSHFRINCEKDDCEKNCDQWPWMKRACSDSDVDAGKNLTVGREPEWRKNISPQELAKLYDFCSQQKVLVCLAASTGLTPAETTAATAEEASTQEITPNGNDQVRGGSGGSDSTSKGMAPWLIAVFAVVVAVVLIAIIVAIVVVKKRAKNRAAMQKKLAESKKSSKEPLDTGKRDEPVEPSAPSLRATSMSLEFSGRGKGEKDESLLVSLRDNGASQKPGHSVAGSMTKSGVGPKSAVAGPQAKRTSLKKTLLPSTPSSKSAIGAGKAPISSTKQSTSTPPPKSQEQVKSSLKALKSK